MLVSRTFTRANENDKLLARPQFSLQLLGNLIEILYSALHNIVYHCLRKSDCTTGKKVGENYANIDQGRRLVSSAVS
jgi:hypothetical protein